MHLCGVDTGQDLQVQSPDGWLLPPESYLSGAVDVVLPERHSAAPDPPEGLPQRLLDALHSRQRSLHGQLVAGVQSAPGSGRANEKLYNEHVTRSRIC